MIDVELVLLRSQASHTSSRPPTLTPGTPLIPVTDDTNVFPPPDNVNDYNKKVF